MHTIQTMDGDRFETSIGLKEALKIHGASSHKCDNCLYVSDGDYFKMVFTWID